MGTVENQEVIIDFSSYVDTLILANDVDPDYPILTQYAIKNKLDKDNEVFLYFWFSIVDNSVLAIDFFERIGGWPVTKSNFQKFEDFWMNNKHMFNYGKERLRNFGNTIRHLQLYLDAMGSSQVSVLNNLINTDDPYQNYRNVREFISTIKYFGTLTRYDYLELLQRGACFNILPPDMCTVVGGCYGPVNATLVVLSEVSGSDKTQFTDEKSRNWNFSPLVPPSYDTKTKPKRAQFLNEQSVAIADRVQSHRGFADVALTESCLCKYQKIKTGSIRYFAGWEICEAMGELYTYDQKNPGFNRKPIEQIRQEVFAPAFLLENRISDVEALRNYRKIKPHHLARHMKELESGVYDKDLLDESPLVDQLSAKSPVQRYFAAHNYLAPVGATGL